MAQPHRRQVMAGAAAVAAIASDARAQDGWNAGPVRHLIPTVSDRAIRLKASFAEPVSRPPELTLNGHRAPGAPTARDRRHWRFEASGLRPATTYTLQLSVPGQGRTDPWPLRTAPSRNAHPERLRILTFTCAGGDQDLVVNGRRSFIPLHVRTALLRRGLSFSPDVVVANGDHIYWDQESGRRRSGGQPDAVQRAVGALSERAGAIEDERILATIGERQIVGLYGVDLRSTPAWFVRDDHDYFENDEFYGDHATFPPSPLHRALTGRLQAMFWPEFLPDADRPRDLPGAEASFGTLRWGRLAEALMYDCRAFLSAQPGRAWFVPPSAEAWIAARTRDPTVRHVMQVPSTPWGWTAGKRAEWYPDFRGADGRVSTETPKPGWRREWHDQHQRLLRLAGSRGRDSLSISGDLHASGSARIERSGDLVPASGVHTVLAGTLGSDDLAFPSAFRGTPPVSAAGVLLESHLDPVEKNGFTLLDVTRDSLRIRQFVWRAPEPEGRIAGLMPTLDKTVST